MERMKKCPTCNSKDTEIIHTQKKYLFCRHCNNYTEIKQDIVDDRLFQITYTSKKADGEYFKTLLAKDIKEARQFAVKTINKINKILDIKEL